MSSVIWFVCLAWCFFSLVMCKKLTHEDCLSLFKIVDENDTQGLEDFLKRTKHFGKKSLNLVRCKRDCFNPWLVAVDGGPLLMVEMLIASCDEETIKSVDSEKYNAIHFAARTGSSKVLQALLAADVNPNAVANDKCTALIIASANGHTEFVQTLLPKTTPVILNHRTNETSQCMNALFAACQADSPEIAKMLLEKGADIYSVDSKERYVLERTILSRPNAKCIDVLLKFIDKKSDDVVVFSDCIIKGISAAIVENNNELRKILDAMLLSRNITHDIIIPPNVPIPTSTAKKLAELYLINQEILNGGISFFIF